MGRITLMHAGLDDLGVKGTATVHGITGGGSGHFGLLIGANIGADARGYTRTPRRAIRWPGGASLHNDATSAETDERATR